MLKKHCAALSVLLLILLALTVGLLTVPPVQKPDSALPADTPITPEPEKGDAVNVANPRPEGIPAGEENSVERIPADWMDGGIFSDGYARAYARLRQMTLEEKAGQVFLARCPQSGAPEFAAEYQPGGFVLFREDFQGRSREQVVAAIASCQKAAGIPMLMAVDEEGGEVVRISSNPLLADQPFRSPMRLYREEGLEAIREDAAEKARLLTGLGVNLNLAPVCDVSTDPRDYIYSRTLGKGAEEVSAYAAAVVETARASGLSSALKHFPGYGNNRDTHIGLSIDERPLESFEANDLLPFQAGIDAGAEAVLVSHNIVECMDAEYPASLSPKVHELLRNRLGFTGLCLTDDLKMEGVRRYSGERSTAVMALLAGNDLLVTSDFSAGRDALLKAAEDGILPGETLDRAVFRVLAMKYHIGLLKDE